jgi:hypothetical protein
MKARTQRLIMDSFNDEDFRDVMMPWEFKVVCQWCGKTDSVDIGEGLAEQGWNKFRSEHQLNDQDHISIEYWLHSNCYEKFLKK